MPAWIFSLVVPSVAALALPSAALASSEFYLLYRQWQSYDWPQEVPSASAVTRVQHGLGWRRPGGAGTVGFDYDYQPLRIRTGDPAHNGHLHRITFGGHWEPGLYRLQARAGLAGTSNMFRYQTFHGDVLNARVALFRTLDEGSPLSLGVGGDHRFGSFQWLPRVRWEQSGESGQWLMDLPVLLRWRSASERWEFRLERKGDRWATLDRSREVEDALYLREWRAELAYRIGSPEPWPALVLGGGASVDTRVRYRDLQSGTLDQRLGDAIFASMRLDW